MPARHKGIHTDSHLDRYWPHHAVIPWENCCEKAYEPAHGRARGMGCAERMVFIRRDNREYLGFRFKEPHQAEAMAAEFGGVTYNALDRSKGSGWEKWRKKATTVQVRQYGGGARHQLGVFQPVHARDALCSLDHIDA